MVMNSKLFYFVELLAALFYVSPFSINIAILCNIRQIKSLLNIFMPLANEKRTFFIIDHQSMSEK